MKRFALLSWFCLTTIALAGDDLSLVNANMGKVTAVPNGEVIFSPSLSITPARKTVVGGDIVTLIASGSTNPITWFTIDNTSGGTLTPITPDCANYQGGGTPSSIDVLEAWDGDYRFARAYMNVISAAEVSQVGKAIVIAGRASVSDPIWPSSDYLADLGYNTLLYRGFSKANIRYLSPEPNQDADGNGEMDDIWGPSTLANAANCFTNWAGNANKLFVYLVDHGNGSSNGLFKISPTEDLTAGMLASWLNTLQDAHTNMEITVVIDCCQAGSFINDLAYGGTAQRIVIASCTDIQPTYFVAGGLVSFSDAFFCAMMMGYDVEQCFEAAAGAMSTYQVAWIDDDKNGVHQAGIDGGNSAGVYIGASFVAGKDIPQIGLVCGNQLLTGATKATLWADYVVSGYPIERVWCMVVPPGHVPDPDNPVSDIPQLDLEYNSTSGRYEAEYTGFSDEGTYKIVYYAQDIWGSVSLPVQSFVMQSGYKEKLIIVAGCLTNSPAWTSVNSLCDQAYGTFRSRWFAATNIWCVNPLSPQDMDKDGTNDVDELPTLAGLANAITNWAWGANKLTVYLIGEGSNNTFRLNETEWLSPADLDYWIDVFQQSNAEACVVMDFAGAGGFVSYLRPPGDAQRVTIASAKAAKPSCHGNKGVVSFSRHFLSNIFKGLDLGTSFASARDSIRIETGTTSPQEAIMDDNFDGVSDKKDGTFAKTWHLGTAFMTGADTPAIGDVSADPLAFGSGAVLLSASEVTDMDGISNVWCVITPPDYGGEGDLPELNLAWNAVSGRYEVTYTNFIHTGLYVFTYHAMDINGEVSSPAQCLGSSGDAYEPDDTPLQARAFEVGEIQRHTFHASNEVDWVKFYALTNYVYEIKATQMGTNVDLVMDVFLELPDGTLTNVLGEVDMYGKGTNEFERTYLNFPLAGVYFVRLKQYDSNDYGAETDYDLHIWIPAGDAGILFLAVVDKLNNTQSPPGATVIVDGGAPQSLNGNNSLSISGLSAGNHVIQVPTMAGYLPEEDPALPNQVVNMNSLLYGIPRNVNVNASGLRVAVFQFVPYAEVRGTVKDAWTGEKLNGAKVEFKAKNGVIAGLTYDGYPAGATYKTNWFSRTDGTFPTNVWLPTVNWDMTIGMADYSNNVVISAVTNLSAGQVVDLGSIKLYPADTNSNCLPDGWEKRHFPGQSTSSTNDPDGDGRNNWHEYLCGTDPTNIHSVLHVDDCRVTNELTLTWPVVVGRIYRVATNDALLSGIWGTAAGPWEATNGQTQMQWSDTDISVATNRFYRVQLIAQ